MYKEGMWVGMEYPYKSAVYDKIPVLLFCSSKIDLSNIIIKHLENFLKWMLCKPFQTKWECMQ